MEYTAKYTLAHEAGAWQMQFYCALCGAHYTTGWIVAATEAQARALAEKEARAYFNGCRRCGRWICDDHYDMQEMMCLECAPQGGGGKAKKQAHEHKK